MLLKNFTLTMSRKINTKLFTKIMPEGATLLLLEFFTRGRYMGREKVFLFLINNQIWKSLLRVKQLFIVSSQNSCTNLGRALQSQTAYNYSFQENTPHDYSPIDWGFESYHARTTLISNKCHVPSNCKGIHYQNNWVFFDRGRAYRTLYIEAQLEQCAEKR